MTPSTPPTVTSTATSKNSNIEPVEPIVILLFVGVFLLLAMLLAVEKMFPNDGQVFQVVAGLLATMSGALFMRIKPKDAGQDKVTTKVETPPTASK